jgi:hypothetical protein
VAHSYLVFLEGPGMVTAVATTIRSQRILILAGVRPFPEQSLRLRLKELVHRKPHIPFGFGYGKIEPGPKQAEHDEDHPDCLVEGE